MKYNILNIKYITIITRIYDRIQGSRDGNGRPKTEVDAGR